MKIRDIILEAQPFKHSKTETIAIGPIKCIVSGHLWDQRDKELDRQHITDQQIWNIIKRVQYIKPKLDQMAYHDKFYLRDSSTGVELGCRFTSFGDPVVRILYINTVVFKQQARVSSTPTINVNPALQEGGWDTTLTQGTVLHPKIVAVALQVVDRFVADFNIYLKPHGLGPVRRGRPTGSSAHHEADTQENPDKVYGDIDLQMIGPEAEGQSYAQFTTQWNKLADDFVKAGKAPYVDTSESKPGHPIFGLGNDQFVQIDFMWHPERLEQWGASRVTPERGVKGLLHGNMFSVLGELLDLSIQHAGVQLKVVDGKHVPFSKQKGTEVVTVTTSPTTFIYDTFMYLSKELGIKNPKIDPLLKQNPGNDVDNVKIIKLVNGITGFARSCEANGMFGHGDLANFTSAQDFLQKFLQRYDEKAQIDIAGKKRDKATTPDAIARATSDREKIQQGLDIVKGYFK